MTNSYMLPQGTRPAARPRVTRVAAWKATPTTLRLTPTTPALVGTGEGEAGAPAVTSTFRSPKAYSTAYASMAKMYETIVTTNRLLERAPISSPSRSRPVAWLQVVGPTVRPHRTRPGTRGSHCAAGRPRPRRPV